MIFELSVSSQRPDDKGSALHSTVAKIANQSLPRFCLARHSVVNLVQNVVDQLTGKLRLRMDVDAGTFPEFAKQYWLEGSDSAAVLAFLVPPQIALLGNSKAEGVMATNSRYFVYFESGSLRSERDHDTFITTVETLIANLL
jgi:hypothetical protein